MLDLQRSERSESELRRELECWIPPFVSWAVQQKSLIFPVSRDLTGIVFDIINSGQIHDIKADGRHVRTLIIQLFSECILRHNGWRESHSGDSGYGHFGLHGNEQSADAALAVANEFRAGLKSLSTLHNIPIECGLGLHLAKNALVSIHTVHLNTGRGPVVQKSFDTTSADIDLLHRMEKLAHELPGSNIILSQELVGQLRNPPKDLEPLEKFLYAVRGDRLNCF